MDQDTKDALKRITSHEFEAALRAEVNRMESIYGVLGTAAIEGSRVGSLASSWLAVVGAVRAMLLEQEAKTDPEAALRELVAAHTKLREVRAYLIETVKIVDRRDDDPGVH